MAASSCFQLETDSRSSSARRANASEFGSRSRIRSLTLDPACCVRKRLNWSSLKLRFPVIPRKQTSARASSNKLANASLSVDRIWHPGIPAEPRLRRRVLTSAIKTQAAQNVISKSAPRSNATTNEYSPRERAAEIASVKTPATTATTKPIITESRTILFPILLTVVVDDNFFNLASRLPVSH